MLIPATELNWALIYGLSLISWTYFLFYMYKSLTNNFDYFNKLGVKGPKPIIIFGNLWELLFVPKHELEVRRLKQYGNIFGIFEGNKPVLQVADPTLVHRILVTDFRLFNNKTRIPKVGHPVIARTLFQVTGQQWRRVRACVRPVFTTARMRKQHAIIEQCVVRQLYGAFDKCARARTPCDVKRVFACFTLSAIACAGFSARVDPYNDPRHPFARNSWRLFAVPGWKLLAMQFLPRWSLKLLGLNSFFHETDLQGICQTVRAIMAEKATLGVGGDDMLDVLMAAKTDTQINDTFTDEGNVTVMESKRVDDNDKAVKGLTDAEIVAQGFAFIIAGFDQISNLLSFCAYELALTPHTQQRLYEEIVAAMGGSREGPELGFDALSALPYLDAVVKETLRLHGSPLKLNRVPGEDYPLGDTGLVVPRGQPLEIPIYAMHHSDTFFPEAHRFIPDRFLPDNSHKLIPYSYVPFSAGPRVCVAQSFAEMETKLALARVVLRYRFVADRDTCVPPIVRKHPIFKTLVTMYLRVECRE